MMQIRRATFLVCSVALFAGLFLLHQQAAAADDASLDKLMAAVATYKSGQSRAALTQVTKLVAEASKELDRARPLARRLARILESPEASREAKIFICRKLWLIATVEQLPVLSKLLDDEDLSHMARYVLQPMRDPAVDAALRDALGRLKGKMLVGVINTIGQRRDLKATDALIQLLRHEDESVATAAARALGNFGDPRAAKAIAAARARAAGRFKDSLTQAWLHGADSLLKAGHKDEAAAIFETLYDASEPRHVRTAALRGRLATTEADKSVKLLVELVGGRDPAMQTAAISFLAEMPDRRIAKAMAALLPKLDPAAQRAMVDALARRGDRAAAPAIAALARSSGDETVRLAAVRALGRLGDASVIELLGALSASVQGELRDAARVSLVRLRGEEMDAAILATLGGADEPVRIELVRSLRERRATAFTRRIAEIAEKEKSAAVRRECFAALAELANAELLDRLVQLMLKEPDASARSAAEKAVLAAVRQLGDPSEGVRAILAVHARAAGAARGTTLRVLGRLGGSDALAAVRRDLHHPEEVVRDAAVRLLAEWPDAAVADDLLSLARTSTTSTHRILALRGYIRVIGLPSKRPFVQTIRMYEQALGLTTRPDEKRLALSGLASFPHPETLKIAQACMKDPALKAEAEQAVRKIKGALNRPIALASHNAKVAHQAVDGNKETRWKSLVSQSKGAGIWFMLDLRTEKTIRRIVLEGSRRKPRDFPREYEVYVSNDPNEWGKPVVTGKGRKTTVEIRIPPTAGRYLKIVSTGSAPHNWSVYEIQIDAK